MLQAVFIDLRFFLLFFAFVIATFTAIMAIIVQYDDDLFDGISYFAYYLMAFRTSIGAESYANKSTYKIISWLVWFIILIVGNVIFMNFIIAVVNESYNNCMGKRVA